MKQEKWAKNTHQIKHETAQVFGFGAQSFFQSIQSMQRIVNLSVGVAFTLLGQLILTHFNLAGMWWLAKEKRKKKERKKTKDLLFDVCFFFMHHHAIEYGCWNIIICGLWLAFCILKINLLTILYLYKIKHDVSFHFLLFLIFLRFLRFLFSCAALSVHYFHSVKLRKL